MVVLASQMRVQELEHAVLVRTAALEQAHEQLRAQGTATKQTEEDSHTSQTPETVRRPLWHSRHRAIPLLRAACVFLAASHFGHVSGTNNTHPVCVARGLGSRHDDALAFLTLVHV